MKKFRMVFLLAVVLGAMAAIPAYAGHPTDGKVTATVTPALVSVTFALKANSTLAYGSLQLSQIAEPGVGTGDAQDCDLGVKPAAVATNTGDVIEDFVIRGFDSIGLDESDQPVILGWDLVDTGSAGNNEYIHKFATKNLADNSNDCTSGTSAGPFKKFTAFPADSSTLPLRGGVAMTGTVDVYLELTMPPDVELLETAGPTFIQNGLSEQLLPVVVQASAT